VCVAENFTENVEILCGLMFISSAFAVHEVLERNTVLWDSDQHSPNLSVFDEEIPVVAP